MIEGWSNLEAKDTSSPYAEICLEAVNDQTVFQKFKQDPRYTAILEHVSIDHGKIYAQDILQYEIDEELINLFKENDSIGGSTIFNYGEPYGRISPSTLRYIQNALDITGNTIQHSVPEELKDIDLVVSNYAYSELNEELQNIYYDNVIVNSNKVYMILNKGQVSREVFLKRAENDFDITIEKVLDFWPPNGYLYYTTMVKK